MLEGDFVEEKNECREHAHSEKSRNKQFLHRSSIPRSNYTAKYTRCRPAIAKKTKNPAAFRHTRFFGGAISDVYTQPEPGGFPQYVRQGARFETIRESQ